MKLRFLFSLLLGVTLATSPAFAKKKDEPKPKESLPTVVDMNLDHDPENIVHLDLSNGGRVSFRMMPEWAPNHVERVKTLVRERFYDGIIFHRVIDGFMAQTGDPTGTGQGGSSYPDLEAEFNSMPHLRGTISMARTNEPNTANSQFFIMFYPRFALDRKYTIFGRVIRGMNIVDAIARGEPPQEPTKIVRASLASEGALPQPPVPAANDDEEVVSIDDLINSASD